ncbi:MAG: DUF3631 domain-containing protein, partial [Pseudonocardiaceae bacterium]
MQEQNPDNGAQLLHQVRDVLARFVILPSDEAAVGVVLWIAATHAVPAWGHAPRLVVRAPEKRCGKSRLLDLVEAMSHRPLMTVNASPSAVYRSIGLAPDDPPTLLMDEADSVFGPKAAGEHEDLRGLLNAGHQRGRPALRYDAGSRRVERIDTFAMAALAGIGAMPDTIEDRAVVIRMRRRAPGESVAPYRMRRDGPALHDLRARLNQWARSNGDQLAAAVPLMPVEDRAADTWEPLIAVADLAAGLWPEASRQAALVLTEAKEASSTLTTQARLLADCRTAFGGAEALSTGELLERLKADPEAPWATYGHNGLTAMRLGSLLREFDITSRNLRLPSGQVKGYLRDDFTDAWNRYCPTVPDPEPSQPSQPSQNDETPGQTTFLPGTALTPGTAQAVPPLQAVPQPSHPKT